MHGSDPFQLFGGRGVDRFTRIFFFANSMKISIHPVLVL